MQLMARSVSFNNKLGKKNTLFFLVVILSIKALKFTGLYHLSTQITNIKITYK